MKCRGHNPDGTLCENEAIANGFCALHQDQVVDFIVDNLQRLQSHLQQLEQSQDVQKMQAKINQLKTKRQQFARRCLSLDACRDKVRDLSIDLQLYLSPDGVNPSPEKVEMVDIANNLTTVAQEGMDEVVDAFELNTIQNQTNQEKIRNLERELEVVTKELERQRQESQRALHGLQGAIQATKQEREQNETLQAELQKVLANVDGVAATATGKYVEENAKLQQQLDVAREQARVYKQREIDLDLQLREWLKAEQDLDMQIRDLHDSYEQKIKDLQKDYEVKINRGEHVLSMREQHLTRDIQELQKALKVAMDELDLANQKTKEAHQFLSTSDCGNLAQELLNVNARLKNAQDAREVLQRERDAMVTDRARLEVSLRNRLKEGQKEMEKKYEQANRDIQLKNQEIMNKHQELTNLTANINALRTSANNTISQLQMQLTQVQFELRKHQSERSMYEKRMAEEKKLMMDGLNNQRLQNQLELEQKQQEIRRKYEAAQQNLLQQQQNVETQQKQQKQQLIAAQKRLKAQEDILQTKLQEYNLNQANYTASMYQYQKQSEELKAAIAQSKQQGDQLLVAEKNFRIQMDAARQTAAVDREQYLREKENLTKQLLDLREAHSKIQSTLNECSTARDALLLRADHMKHENEQMKVKFSQMQAQYENHRAQSSLTIEKLRTDSNKMRTSIAEAALQLDQVPAIHAHNLELEKQMKFYQQQTKEHALELQFTKQQIEKVLAANQLASQRVNELQNALKACDSSKRFLETSHAATKEQLEAIRRVNQDVVQVAQQNSMQFVGLMEEQKREADHQLHKSERERKQIEQRYETEKKISQQKTQQLIKDAYNKKLMAESLADSAITNAQAIQSIVPRFQVPDGVTPLGRSQLFER